MNKCAVLLTDPLCVVTQPLNPLFLCLPLPSVLIDNRRIKVDFSQSVAKLWNKHMNKPRGPAARGGPGTGSNARTFPHGPPCAWLGRAVSQTSSLVVVGLQAPLAQALLPAGNLWS